MEIRKKFENVRSQISKTISSNNPMSPSPVSSDVQFEFGQSPAQVTAAAYKMAANRTLPLNNPHREQEILSTIDPIYFDPPAPFDAKLYELKGLPDILDINVMNGQRKIMKEQLSVVSKKISDLILKNHPSYAAELVKVTALQKSLKQAHAVCVAARNHLLECRGQTTDGGIKLVGLDCRKRRLKKVLYALNDIKTLRETDRQLNHFMQNGKYCEAIELCLQCGQAAANYSQYKCVGQLGVKLSDSAFLMEEQLDGVLCSLITEQFQPSTYSKLLSAYSLLDKSQAASDHLLINIDSWITECSTNVLNQFIPQKFDSSPESEGTENFRDICSCVASSSLSDCLLQLCNVLWKILHAYHCILGYHKHIETLGDDSCESSATLVSGMDRVWSSCLGKVNDVIASSNLNNLKFDQFLTIMDTANKFTEVGEAHFGSDCSVLAETLKYQTASYFASYHRAKLDEMKMFLETESWTLCPVSSSFTLSDLAEFQFMKNERVSVRNGERRRDELNLIDTEAQNPFSVGNISEQDGVQSDDPNDVTDVIESDDELVEVNRESIDEFPTSKKVRDGYKSVSRLAPILCNTALNLLRLLGRYLHIISLVHSISADVFTSITHLFNYFFYVVVSFYGNDGSDLGVALRSARLNCAIASLQANLIARPGVSLHDRVALPSISSVVPFNFADSLFALAQRITGVESLIFVAKQMNQFQAFLDPLLPSSNREKMQQFFKDAVCLSEDTRLAVYGVVGTKAVNYDRLVQAVYNVNWDVNELMSQHNSYVDFLVQDLENLKLRLDNVAQSNFVPREAYDVLWTVIIRCINRVIVEGYSAARKCSNEGRALMQLDYQQLVRKLENITLLRPIPDMETVNVFVKAYYLPEAAFDQWIADNKNVYSSKQMLNLLQVANIGRKTRMRLSQLLEESL